MGTVINFLRLFAEQIAEENKSKLYIGGAIITFTVVFLSGASGWIIERLFLFFEIKSPVLSSILFAFILSSALASRSLGKSILEIINIIVQEKDGFHLCGDYDQVVQEEKIRQVIDDLNDRQNMVYDIVQERSAKDLPTTYKDVAAL